MTTSMHLRPTDALLVVDVQRDFCPGGALAVPGGDQVVSVVNRWIDRFVSAGALVVASRDRHPPQHVSFHSRAGPWPPHCVKHTRGAELHPELKLPEQAVVVFKGQHPDRDAYSAFDGTELASVLKRRGVRRVFVAGLAQDVCVQATVLDALRSGFEVHVLLEATRPVDPRQGKRAIELVQSKGAIVEGA